MKSAARSYFVVVFACLLGFGCGVKKAAHQKVLDELTSTRLELDKTRSERDKLLKGNEERSSPEEGSPSSLDPKTVVKQIRENYLRSIKHCHQQVLKIDPKAQGKVTVRFTVGFTGRVTKVSVNGFDTTVDECIKTLATQWSFPVPRDEGQPTSAEFEVPFLLKPGT